MEDLISMSNIYEYGEKARKEQSEIDQNCGDIIDYFEGLLQDYCGLGWKGDITDKYERRHVRVGPNGEEKHYIFQIDGLLLEGYKEGEQVWIDLSFDQFNDKNKQLGLVDVSYGKREEIEKIQVLRPNDERRKQRYSTISEYYN